MNFLAHIYLSGNNDHVKIGNFMADGIRGKNFGLLPSDIQKGIILHRAIDTYTDAHPVFRQSTKRLHERYHHYAGVIVDVFYDHFLAKNWQRYSQERLEDFVEQFYETLRQNYAVLNEKTQNLMPFMIQYNWLVSYRELDGLARILSQMDQRTGLKSKMKYSTEELQLYYGDFENEFLTFFDDIRTFATAHLTTL